MSLKCIFVLGKGWISDFIHVPLDELSIHVPLTWYIHALLEHKGCQKELSWEYGPATDTVLGFISRFQCKKTP